jgi:hypothetical protein
MQLQETKTFIIRLLGIYISWGKIFGGEKKLTSVYHIGYETFQKRIEFGSIYVEEVLIKEF